MPVLPSNFEDFQRVSAQYAQGAANFALAIAKMGQAESQFKERLKMERENFDLERQKFAAQQDLQKLRLEAAQVELDAFRRKETEAAATQAGVRTFLDSGAYTRYRQTLMEGSPQQQQEARREFLGALAGQPLPIQAQFLEAEMARQKIEVFPQQAAAELQKTLMEGAQAGAGISTDQFKMAQQLGTAAKDVITAGVDAQEQELNRSIEGLENELKANLGTIKAAGITANVLAGVSGFVPVEALHKVQAHINAVSAQLTTLGRPEVSALGKSYLQGANQLVALLQQKRIVQVGRAAADRISSEFQYLAYTTPGISLQDMTRQSGAAARDIEQLPEVFALVSSVKEVKTMLEGNATIDRTVVENAIRQVAGGYIDKPWRSALVGSLHGMLIEKQRINMDQKSYDLGAAAQGAATAATLKYGQQARLK